MFFAGVRFTGIHGEECHPHCIGAASRESRHHFREKFTGNLHHDAGAVAGFVVSPLCAAVFHPAQYLKPPADNIMGLYSLYVRHESDAAGVMFIFAFVEAGIVHGFVSPDNGFPWYLPRETYCAAAEDIRQN